LVTGAETQTLDLSHETQTEAGQPTEDVGEHARSAAQGFVDQAAIQLAAIANAVEAAADELRNQQQEGLARKVDQLASGLDRFAHRLGRDDLQSVMDDARDWARDNPAGFLSGSVLAGLAASRMFKTSQTRRL
jgi:hypothetical protein